MNFDPEMELWRKEWSSTNDSPVVSLPDQVLVAALRCQRRSHLTLAANIGFAIILLAGSLVVAKRIHSLEMVLWAVCVWMTTLVASHLSLEGWRRSRMTTMESVTDYARFHRKRAVADLWRVRTGVFFLCVQATIAAVWLTADLLRMRIHLLHFGVAIAVLLGISSLWAYVFLQMRKRAVAILATDITEEAITQLGSEQRLK
jgi:hypothetical protein